MNQADLVPKSTDTWRLDAFDLSKKNLFISMFSQGLSVIHICGQLEISRATYEYHKRQDKWFRSCLDACREVHCDDLESVTLENARRKEGFQDRISYLKAFRPEVWRDKGHESQVAVQININQGAIETAKKRQESIDASIEV